MVSAVAKKKTQTIYMLIVGETYETFNQFLIEYIIGLNQMLYVFDPGWTGVDAQQKYNVVF